jgi:hypothetical protein
MTEEQVRAIVKDALRAKQAEIEGLRERLRQLEQTVATQQQVISRLQQGGDSGVPQAQELAEPPFQPTPAQAPVAVEQEEPRPALAITGFLDFSARAPTDDDTPFDLGGLEVDLEYRHSEHVSSSAALAWDGDTAEVAVAIIDYHWFDDRVPPRGRIFIEPGFHLQAGRFDLPFGVDYQYFAAPDRPTVTAPLTTERIQRGGFNSDGVRVYGKSQALDYAAYWTNAFYGGRGSLLGGRVGLSAGRNPYRFHFRSVRYPTVDLGISYLQEVAPGGEMRDRVYGADATIEYGRFKLISEAMLRDSSEELITADDPSLGEGDESGFHVTLVAKLRDWLKAPAYLFGRVEGWNPGFDQAPDDGTVEDTRRLALGIGFDFSDAIRLKLEYYDYRSPEGEGAREPGLSERGGIAQVTARF